MMHNKTTPWMVRRANDAGHIRLYCFAYAGGSAAVYAGWQKALAPQVDVCAIQLPGRGTRMMETPRRAFAPLAEELALAIAGEPGQPFALFGHSLGALLAFEVAHALYRRHLPLPAHLFASGCRAPSVPRAPRGLHDMPDAQFIESIRAYNGTPAEVLENAELMALVMPMLRADFALVDDYRYQRRAPLPLPLTVLAGRGDAAETLDKVGDWAAESTNFRGVRWFDGDHFFLHSQAQAVMAAVGEALPAPVPVWV